MCCMSNAATAVNLQVAFCEERVECRRVLLLTYFGERGFSKERCGATCDVCLRNVGQSFEGAQHTCVAVADNYCNTGAGTPLMHSRRGMASCPASAAQLQHFFLYLCTLKP